jgi:hypothetical protein
MNYNRLSMMIIQGRPAQRPDAGPDPEEAHPLPHERALSRRNREG